MEEGIDIVLGTANFGNNYDGDNLNKEQCFEILKCFEDLGGVYVDTADNYGGSEDFIGQYLLKRECDKKKKCNLKVISKGKKFIDFGYIPDYPEYYIFLYRGKYKRNTEKITGQSVYYPHEIDQRSKIIQIPCHWLFDDYLDIMKVHSKVIARNVYKLMSENIKHYNLIRETYFNMVRDKYDEVVIGVKNVTEVKYNMNIFPVRSLD